MKRKLNKDQIIFLLRCFVISQALLFDERNIWEDKVGFDKRRMIRYNEGCRESVYFYIIDVLYAGSYTQKHAAEFNLMRKRYVDWKWVLVERNDAIFKDLHRFSQKRKDNPRATTDEFQYTLELALEKWDEITKVK